MTRPTIAECIEAVITHRGTGCLIPLAQYGEILAILRTIEAGKDARLWRTTSEGNLRKWRRE